MKWSVGAKIAGGFGLALAMLAVIGIVSYQSTRQLIGSSKELLQRDEIFNHIDGYAINIQMAEASQRGYLVTGEDHYLEPYNAATSRLEQGFQDMKSLLSEDVSSSDNKELEKSISDLELKLRDKLKDLDDTLIVRKTKGPEAAVQHMLTDQGENKMLAIREMVDQLEADHLRVLAASHARAEQSGNRAMAIIIWGSVFALIAMAFAATIITRGIANPLKDMAGAAQRISTGDLRESIASLNRNDEVGALANSFARMTEYLQSMARTAERIAANDLTVRLSPVESDTLGNAFATMMQNIRTMIMETQEAASVLGSAVAEMAASTSQLATSSSQTATSVSETTTTIEEVRQTAQVATQKAKLVADNAQQAATVSRTGRQAIGESLQAMERIRRQMELIAESIVQLSEQSQSIGEIIATVNDLAEQSNLLAVNAAIEAAKAGEHGRGFAVVAQEVRSLAEQSKQATTRVRGILNDIQKATGATVMATEQGSKAVDAGIRQVGDSGESIRILAETIDASAQSAVQITRSSEEQLIGVDQVAVAMESIKQASLQNMDSAKQVESAARNLHELGQKLKQIVNNYTV